MAVIFVTVTLDILALGVMIPVLPRLVADFLGGHTDSAARIYGLFGTVWAFLHFLCSPAAGALSDRFGRRPIILMSNLGLGMDYILMALAPSLTSLFVGRIISGITASSIPAASAYVADSVPPERRAKAFGILGAAFGLGFVLGPAVGGILGSVSLRLPFWVSAGLSLANACWAFFILPESLPTEKRAAFSWKRANPVGSLKLFRSHPDLMSLAAIHFLRILAHVSLPAVFVLYAGYRYGWNERSVGLSLALMGACGMIVQGGLVGPTVKRFGERTMLLWGLLFGAAGFAVYGWADRGSVLLLLGIPLLSLWGFAGPAIQGLMTRLAGSTEQGLLQGANASLQGIAEMVGPGLFTLTFAYFIRADVSWRLPGAPYYLSAGLLAAALLVGWMLPAGSSLEDEIPAATGVAAME